MAINREQAAKFILDGSLTYEEIARRFGVSRQRIFQIAKKTNSWKARRERWEKRSRYREEKILPNLLTIKQVAEILTVCRRTVTKWIRERRLPRVKLGGCVRIPREGVEEFILQNTTSARYPETEDVRGKKNEQET